MSFPTFRHYSARGEFPDRGLFNVPVDFQGTAQCTNGVEMISKNGDAGVNFICEEGTAYCSRGRFTCSENELRRRKPDQSEITLYESKNQMLDFLNSAREGQDPICPVEVGHRSNTVAVLHHMSMKLGGRALKWDPVTEMIIGDKEASSLLGRALRKPWSI